MYAKFSRQREDKSAADKDLQTLPSDFCDDQLQGTPTHPGRFPGRSVPRQSQPGQAKDKPSQGVPAESLQDSFSVSTWTQAGERHFLGTPGSHISHLCPDRSTGILFSSTTISTPALECVTVDIVPSIMKPARHLLQNPHVVDVGDVCRFYEVDPQNGLSAAAVEVYRARFGLNELEHEEGKSVWSLLIEQFQDLLARILLMAAGVSFFLALISGGKEEGLAAFVEPIVILLILVANAAVSVWQESNAEKSLESLKKLQPELARVLRDRAWINVPTRDLVPGDIVEVRVGDKVPADLRVLKLLTVSLRAEQSLLTGETQTVPKESSAMDKSWCDCEIQSKVNLLFSSTTIANGGAHAIVISTGMETEIGHIQSAVQAAGLEEEQTPLQEKLDEFGEMLSKVIGVICVVVWLINFGNFSEPSHGGFVRGCIYYFKTAVALAVAAIPEGLTAVITTCLALGTRKMAQNNAIVRRLPSVETLGCTTVICSDKTGTLTTNEMSCVRFAVPKSGDGLDVFTVEGHTYTPVGRIFKQGSGGKAVKFVSIGPNDFGLQYLAKCATICNESKLELHPNIPGRFIRHGEPTEAALKVLVEKLGCPDESLNRNNLQTAFRRVPESFGQYWTRDCSRLAVLEFTRDRKSMSVLCRERGSANTIQFVKGAPESILDRCTQVILPDGTSRPMNGFLRQKIMEEVETMAGDALRTLALAVRLDTETLSDYCGADHHQHASLTDPENFIKFEQKLSFCGLVGLVDPPRPEVAGAISLCRNAGIKVMMITGDNKKTAEAIAVKVGIISGSDLNRLSFTGKEFEALSESEKVRVLSSSRGAVFSRTEPKHKQLVIKILKELGEITAMTGDGVNDAPALKQADIGISMGVTGTEVAKEASDMILADDNFSTIVFAVEEGRSIYNNMKAFIRYLISSNIGEVASIFFTAALGIPEGLAPVQLLWVNLVTDGFPATALGFNPPDVDVMKKTPRRRDDPLISGWVFLRYMIVGLYVGFATVGIFIWWFVYGVDPSDGHTLIFFRQLTHWSQCHSWSEFAVNSVYGMDPSDPCSYFNQGKIKASTLSLTVLVIIEMFNALNALSEDGSLLQLPPWSNPWLVLAIAGSVAVHCAILYFQPLASIFGVVPLSIHDWIWVVIWSFPVLLIDEMLKAYARLRESKARPQIGGTGRPKKIQ